MNILETAALLLSEDGENTEYDRAIVELVSDLLGIPMDMRAETLAILRSI